MDADNVARTMTLHPQGKQGVNIETSKYEAMAAAIVAALREEGDLTFQELEQAVTRRLAGGFDGAIAWYLTTVKLDLEARHRVERTGKQSPQRLHLVV